MNRARIRRGLIGARGAGGTLRGEEARAEVRQRLERGRERSIISEKGTTTETPDEAPLAKPAA